MNKIFLFVISLIFTASAAAQSEAYKDLIKYVKKQGWTFYTDKQIYLKQNESSNGKFTLPGNREYKIYCVPEYSEVTDVDSWVYDIAGNLLGKDVEDDRMAIVTFDAPVQSDFKVTIKNIKATMPSERFACRILITYQVKTFSSSSTTTNSYSMSPTELYEKGNNFYYGRGVAKDFAEAINWFKLAADEGNVNAMHALGLMYRNGEGVSVNYTTAMRWYQTAADKGYARSINAIGLMYAEAQGVQQDYWEALKWFQKAADKGFASSMYNIGMMYKNGKGVTKNIEEARRWFKKAADAGYEGGEKMLKKL